MLIKYDVLITIQLNKAQGVHSGKTLLQYHGLAVYFQNKHRYFEGSLSLAFRSHGHRGGAAGYCGPQFPRPGFQS
ncbi:hypothetical protein D3C86_2131040 [compost metagenome]